MFKADHLGLDNLPRASSLRKMNSSSWPQAFSNSLVSEATLGYILTLKDLDLGSTNKRDVQT